MRVTDLNRIDSILRSTATANSQLYDATREASSGQRIYTPSVDPAGAANVVRMKATIDRTESFRKVIDTVSGDAALAEATLESAGTVLSRARELAMQGANGNLSAQDRTYLAQELTSLRSQLVAIANQKGSTGYLFGGSQTQGPPFTATGVFTGDNVDRIVEVGPGVSTKVNVSGANAFTATTGGRDIFQDLTDLQNALAGNNQPGIQASIDAIDAGYTQILSSRADAGAIMTRLDATTEVHVQTQAALTVEKAKVGDADATESYSNLVALQRALEQSLAVARQTLATLSASRAA